MIAQTGAPVCNMRFDHRARPDPATSGARRDFRRNAAVQRQG